MEHEKNDNFNALKNEYLNGDENLQDKILNDLAVLGKGIKFDIFLGDTSGSLGLTEFNVHLKRNIEMVKTGSKKELSGNRDDVAIYPAECSCG